MAKKQNGAVQQREQLPFDKRPAPEQGSKIYWDDTENGVGGFGVRVWATGARTFVLDYRVRGSGRQRRYKVGDCGNWTTAGARIEARRLRPSTKRGGDPMGDLQDERAAATMLDLCDRFEKEHLSRKVRDSTAGDY